MQGHDMLIGPRWFDAVALLVVLAGGLGLLGLRAALIAAVAARVRARLQSHPRGSTNTTVPFPMEPEVDSVAEVEAFFVSPLHSLLDGS